MNSPEHVIESPLIVNPSFDGRRDESWNLDRQESHSGLPAFLR